MVRALRHRGHPVLLTRRLPRRGLAEHRAYLLAASAARYVLCLDDDVWLEPGTLRRLVTAIEELGCGFVGNAVHGLSYADDVRAGDAPALRGVDRPAHAGTDPPRARRSGIGRRSIRRRTCCTSRGNWTCRRVAGGRTGCPGSAAACSTTGRSWSTPAGSTSGGGCREAPGRGRRRPARRAGALRRRRRPAQRRLPPGVADHGHRPGGGGVGGRARRGGDGAAGLSRRAPAPGPFRGRRAPGGAARGPPPGPRPPARR